MRSLAMIGLVAMAAMSLAACENKTDKAGQADASRSRPADGEMLDDTSDSLADAVRSASAPIGADVLPDDEAEPEQRRA